MSVPIMSYDHLFRMTLCLLLLAGCGPSSTKPAAEPASTDTPTAPALEDPVGDAVARLHRELAAKNPEYRQELAHFEPREGRLAAAELRGAGIADLSPLAGMELELIGLAENPVSDLSPLQGMPLSVLDLEGTQVSDLPQLAGTPLLSELSLLGTAVTDLTPLSKLPLENLWLNETQVTDLSPLADCPLVSLTLHKTPVSDLAFVTRLRSLQRLHIGETQVTDLRPLAGARLTRLIVTPDRVEQGWEVVREMSSLQELDVEFREGQRWTPAEFWQRVEVK
jgi:internalin A